jgi:SH3-like domain-containing protein
MTRLERRVRIKLEHIVEYPNPLEVVSGDKVSVGREDDEFPGWRWCKAPDGRQGWIPVELLAGEGAEAIVVQEYSARELGVKPGEAVIVEDARHSWLLVRNARGERGWIPERNTETMD